MRRRSNYVASRSTVTLAQTLIQNFAANKLKEPNEEKKKKLLQSLLHDFVKFWQAVIV